jgi:UDP-N-acetyl-D-galactosamine dehydrogenase
LARLYGAAARAGVHIAPTIKAAETAKVLENTQRDLNIALMNELAIICDLMGIRTKDVLEAAGTKWNFLQFTPGLVGGHCIGVDPYYLTSRAEELGYHPEVILAGRRVNDGMGAFIARRTIRFLAEASVPFRDARVGIFGVTFKEDVRDARNSRIPDMIAEFRNYGISPMVCDAVADPKEVKHEYGLDLTSDLNVRDLDALLLAVPHKCYLEDRANLFARLREGGVLIDIKSTLLPKRVPTRLRYWSL